MPAVSTELRAAIADDEALKRALDATPLESGLQTGEHLIHNVPAIEDPWQYAEQGRGSQRWRAGLIGGTTQSLDFGLD